MSGLKPCPFCGADVKIASEGAVGFKDGTAKLTYFIRCPNCGARNKEASGNVGVRLQEEGSIFADGTELDRSVEAWNRRAE